MNDNSQDINADIVEEETKNNTKGKKIIIMVTILLAVILIAVGGYFQYLGNPKKIVATALDTIAGTVKDISFIENTAKVGDNYTLNSDIKMNLESGYITSLAGTDANYLAISNMFKNLNNTENKLIISQDKKNKQMLLEFNSTLNQNELFYGKYLIEDSTEYYYIKGFLDTYINNGSSNYFESLDENNTSRENIVYIYDFVINSIKNNLKDEYFEKKQESLFADGKEQKLTKVSVKFTDERLKEIASLVLRDLKNDSRANKILIGIYPDFSKAKVEDDAEVLGDNQFIIMNVYTSNWIYQAKKYEFILGDDVEQFKITYEKLDGKGVIYIIDNDQVIYTLNVTRNDDEYKMELLNTNGKIGTIEIENDSEGTSFSLNVSTNGYRIDMGSVCKIENKANDYSYTNNCKVSFKVVQNSNSLFSGVFDISTKIDNQVKIDEDVSNSILASSVTDEQRRLLEQKLTTTFSELAK